MVTIFVILGLFLLGMGVFKVGAFFVEVSEDRAVVRSKQSAHTKTDARVDSETTVFTTAEEVKEFFKNKSNILTWGHKNNRTGGIIGILVSRALSTMTDREANALYYSELFGVLEYIDKNETQTIHSHIIYNNGVCERWVFWIDDHTGKLYIQPNHQYLANWMDNGTAQSGITKLMNAFAKIEAERKDDPLVREFRAKVIGGNSWADDAALLTGGTFSEHDDLGLFIGTTETGTRIVYTGEGSLVTIAPPGSGKTRCHAIPTLLSYRGPAIVLDVKGDCFDLTSQWRRDNFGPVLKFNPLNPEDSARYNPLDAISDNPRTLWEECRLLSDLLIVPESRSEPEWEGRARNVVQGAVAWLISENKPERRMGHVLDVLAGGTHWETFLEEAKYSKISALSRLGDALTAMPEKQREGVLDAARRHLAVWEGVSVEEVTAASDWSPAVLTDGSNSTIYICIAPGDVESYAGVLRVILAQHLRELLRTLPPAGRTPILFLLDELPRLGAMKPVEQALAVGRQYGIRLWMFTQDFGQLSRAYENAVGMISNCEARLYMHPGSFDETAKKLAEELGEVERLVDGTRRLMVEPHVLAGPEYANLQIMMTRGRLPARLNKVFVHNDPEFMARMPERPVPTFLPA